MSRIEELVERLCPGGVEFKRMGDVGEFVRGSGLQKTDFRETGVGCIHYGQIYTYYGTFTHKTKSFVAPELAAKLKKVQRGDLVIASTSENIEDVCKTVAWLGDEEIVTGGHATIFKHRENPKYLSYLAQTDLFFEQKKKYARGTKVIDVSAKDMAKIEIPVPPLEIQNEIVSILDKYILLEAELEAELEARKTQYEHYRDALLSFEAKNVEWKTLGEIGEFTYGFTDKAKVEGDVRFIRITDINDNGKLINEDKKYLNLNDDNKKYLLKKGDVLMARTGATYGKTMLFNSEEKSLYASFLIKISLDKSIINPSYYWHFAQSKFYWEQAKKLVGGGAQPQFNANVLKSIKVSIPPLSEQERVGYILDKFDALVNDISIGLPAEIEARRQQYEYYRNKLLTFKNVSNG